MVKRINFGYIDATRYFGCLDMGERNFVWDCFRSNLKANVILDLEKLSPRLDLGKFQRSLLSFANQSGI